MTINVLKNGIGQGNSTIISIPNSEIEKNETISEFENSIISLIFVQPI